jgi:hypothetical protein
MDISLIKRFIPQLVPARASSAIVDYVCSQRMHCAHDLIFGGYTALRTENGRLNGDLFEGLFASAMLGAGLGSFIMSAEYSVLPYSKVDMVVYTQKAGPIMLSLKSSLRERWKQSDLEFHVAKQFNPGIIAAIATMDSDGIRQPTSLLNDGQLLGLDRVIDCNLPSQVDSLFRLISDLKPVERYHDNILGIRNFRSHLS